MHHIYVGDCVESMRAMPAGVAQTCVTSPPYYGLRDYGHPGQIGLEKTLAEYVAAMVEVFAQVRRVLRDDGTLWLNLGDSYSGSGKGGGGSFRKDGVTHSAGTPRSKVLDAKQLMGVPWRVAFALQDAGWYLRQDIIWHKPNPMPESVTDRCTKAHEYLFLLTKSERYYWDAEAMQEPATGALPGNKNHKYTTEYEDGGDEKHRTKAGLVAFAQRQRSKRDSFKRENSKRAEVIPSQSVGTHRADRDENDYDVGTRNKRSVWTIATRPFKGAHFATFPPALVEPCILAGSPIGGVVLDPFAGAGTTGLVASRNYRASILCELNPEYASMADARIRGDAK